MATMLEKLRAKGSKPRCERGQGTTEYAILVGVTTPMNFAI